MLALKQDPLILRCQYTSEGLVGHIFVGLESDMWYKRYVSFTHISEQNVGQANMISKYLLLYVNSHKDGMRKAVLCKF